MSSATDSSHGNAQLRRQKELTERLCITPVRRSKGHNLNWSTWKWRLRMRGTVWVRIGSDGPEGLRLSGYYPQPPVRSRSDGWACRTGWRR